MSQFKMILFFGFVSMMAPSVFAMDFIRGVLGLRASDVEEACEQDSNNSEALAAKDSGETPEEQNPTDSGAAAITEIADHNAKNTSDVTPVPLSQSFNVNVASDLVQYFEKTKKTLADNPSLTLIGSLVKGNDQSFWDSLIQYGFDYNELNILDLWWVIEQFSNPSLLAKNDADYLFQIVFESTNPKQKEAILSFLKSVAISKASRISKNFNPHSHSEVHNILVHMIETGHLVAFERILTAFPALLSELSTLDSCQREERTDAIKEAGWVMHTFEYTKINYSLVSWLTRSREGKANLYLNNDLSVRPSYVQAAQIITARIIAQNEGEYAIKRIDQTLYDMVALLFQQKYISAEDHKKCAELRFKN